MTVIAIRNGRVIDPANLTDEKFDIFVKDNRISYSTEITESEIEREIDATGLIVCPGLIDICTQMGEPGSERSSTMRSESMAAIAGGITTVCIQPDTQPVVDTTAMAHMIRMNAQQHSGIRIFPLGALTTGLGCESLTDMAALRSAGCVGVSNARNAVSNTLLMRRAMQYASTFDITVFIQSHDPWLTGNGCVHEGPMSARLGLPAIPEAAETVAIARDLALVETTGVRAHFSQLSCARSVDMIAESKQSGLNVSADVAIHNLLLTESDVQGFNTLCHVLPPLRSESDRDGLRKGLKNGTISIICSDHRPTSTDDKLAPFSQTVAGISGLETLLPLTLKLVEEKVLSLQDAIACLTANPAQTLGVDTGTLSPGSLADICIFDPDMTWELNTERMLSSGKNNPFGKSQLRGKVIHTIVDGNIATDLV